MVVPRLYLVAADFQVEVMWCSGVDETREMEHDDHGDGDHVRDLLMSYHRSCDDTIEEYHDDLAQFQTHTLCCWWFGLIWLSLRCMDRKKGLRRGFCVKPNEPSEKQQGKMFEILSWCVDGGGCAM